MKLKYYQQSVLEELAKKLDRPPLEVLDDLMWNGCKVMKSDKEIYEAAATDLVNFVAIRALKKKVGADKDDKVKCESCYAKIGVNAFDFEYKRLDKERVEIKRCPICGATIEKNYEKLDEAELVDESECEYEDGSIVINRGKD